MLRSAIVGKPDAYTDAQAAAAGVAAVVALVGDTEIVVRSGASLDGVTQASIIAAGGAAGVAGVVALAVDNEFIKRDGASLSSDPATDIYSDADAVAAIAAQGTDGEFLVVDGAGLASATAAEILAEESIQPTGHVDVAPAAGVATLDWSAGNHFEISGTPTSLVMTNYSPGWVVSFSATAASEPSWTTGSKKAAGTWQASGETHGTIEHTEGTAFLLTLWDPS